MCMFFGSSIIRINWFIIYDNDTLSWFVIDTSHIFFYSYLYFFLWLSQLTPFFFSFNHSLLSINKINTLIYSLVLASMDKQCIIQTFTCFYAFSVPFCPREFLPFFRYNNHNVYVFFFLPSFNISCNWSSTKYFKIC